MQIAVALNLLKQNMMDFPKVGDHCSALGRLVGVGGARERSPKTVAVLEGLINERLIIFLERRPTSMDIV